MMSLVEERVPKQSVNYAMRQRLTQLSRARNLPGARDSGGAIQVRRNLFRGDGAGDGHVVITCERVDEQFFQEGHPQLECPV